MELTRKAITETAFTTVTTGGIDPAEVREHLEAIAAALDTPQAVETAETTGARATEVIEAAQQSAHALRGAAEAEAETLRAEARRQADEELAGARSAAFGLVDRFEKLGAAVEAASERVAGAGASAAEALQAAVEQELESLHEQRDGLQAELGVVERGTQTSSEPAPVPDEEPVAESAEATAPPEPAAAEPAAATVEASASPPADEQSAPLLAEDADRPEGDVDAGDQARSAHERARLSALQMALSGVPRQETERHLREEHDEVGDVDGILEDVYSRASEVS